MQLIVLGHHCMCPRSTVTAQHFRLLVQNASPASCIYWFGHHQPAEHIIATGMPLPVHCCSEVKPHHCGTCCERLMQGLCSTLLHVCAAYQCSAMAALPCQQVPPVLIGWCAAALLTFKFSSPAM
jgi:hypothetical protein